MTLRLRVVAHSEVGLVRKMNQDSGYASPRLLVVADGMGGAAAGDLASAVAIDVIKHLDSPDVLTEPTQDETSEEGTEETVVVDTASGTVTEQGAAGRNPMLGRFADAISEANARIADLVADDYNLEGMGTTVTGALFDSDRLALAHIGDSRAYLLRGGRLERLTHDHSWVQSLVDDGKITPEEAAYHPHRSLLLKVLNGQPANDPDLTTVALQPEDRLLFCSDGLCGMVDDEEIAGLAAVADLETAMAGLVDAALAAGGIDNITVILAEVESDTGAPGPSATQAANEDDTAVRGAVAAAGTVLGAAVDRDIPVVARRPPLVPGLRSDDDESDDRAVTRSPTTPTPHDDESRYSPGPPAKRRVVRTLLVGLAVLLVAAAGLGAGYAWTRTQYFVGAADGQVAIYTGLPDGIPGLSLSQVYEVQKLPVSSLPPYYQAQVSAGIEVSGLEAARATVSQLEQAAARCSQPSASPTPSTKPTAKPTTTPSGTPSQTASARPRPTASVSSTPTPSGPPGSGSAGPSAAPTTSPAPGEC